MSVGLEPLRRSAFGVSVGAAVVAVVWSAAAFAAGAAHHYHLTACAAVVTMILPVAWARRAPLGAAVILAVATLVNEVLFGHLVRCAATLPAAFYLAYALASYRIGWRRWVGLAAVLAGIEVQCLDDPQLGAGVIGFMAPATLLFFGAGVLVHSRSVLIDRLRIRNAELREQRERTAALAVAADQARIGTELIDGLRRQIHEVALLAQQGRSGEAPADSALAGIERTGRAALERMRDIVGSIQPSRTDPEPDLRALAEMLRASTTSTVRLVIEGEERALPASIELTGYRIVERLVNALLDDPAARAEVRVSFAAEALELSVSGILNTEADPATRFAGIADRAAIHGGSVRLDDPAGRLDAQVRLPLVSSRG